MATFSQKPSTTPSSSSQSCFDPLDIDRYINYDQNLFPSPSTSPVSSRPKPIASPNTVIGDSIDSPFPTQQSQQVFPPPNHQYDAYHQQAGLAPGALANTVAVNQADHLSFGGRGQSLFAMPPMSTDSYFGLNSTDDFDFGTAPSRNPSIGGTDMDIDFGSPTQDMFMQSMGSSNTDFIDPAAIGGQEDTSNIVTSASATVGRVWPGMHQQQAALKAQAQQQSQQHAAAKPSQSLAASQPRQPAHKSTGSTSRPPTDPIVEERISRLLNQMRHSSVASSNDDDDALTPTANSNGSNTSRMKKDEEDMDEDERLLASEEGKKLSSKERRQLRNKVSARAFRSRRKEYIGQLEGEIAAKAAEADDLRSKNEELMAENTRLGDLTRMLLASPAFSTFLNDLSGGVPSSSAPAQASSSAQTPAMKTEQTQPHLRKDVNPNQMAAHQTQSSHQHNQHVGMTMIPEHTIDCTTFDTGNPGWTDNNMDFSLYDAQVFAVAEVPQGPSFDKLQSEILSGKSSNTVGPYAKDDCKNDVPAIELMPNVSSTADDPSAVDESDDDVDSEEFDPAFALFADSPSISQPTPVEPEEQIFGSIGLEKVFGRVELIFEDDLCDDEHVSSSAMERFQRLCSSMEAASERISAVTSHL